MSNIVIDIAAQFTGKKAFTSTEKAIDKLGKSLKRAVIGGGIAKILTDSAKAFAEDEKAAAMLANTLDNLGLAAFTSSVESMIDKTQLATGVLDEQLRPAFQKLVTSTGDAVQAQELLKLALDISAGSGQDLVTVASDIANVMAGNNKALKKYALGLSAVELKTMSATEVQLKFIEVYGGASDRASKTFSGSMLRIKAAAEMARESLGKGLIDGLMVATGSQNIDQLQQRILDFGTSAGETFRQIGTVINENLGLLKSLAITFVAIWTTGKVIAAITAIITIVKSLTATYKLLRATAVGAAIAQAALLNPLGAIAYAATLVGVITGATISINKLGDAFSNADNKAKKLFGSVSALGNYQMSTGKVLDLAAINASVDAMYLKKTLNLSIASDKAAAAAKIKADKAAAAAKAKADKAALMSEKARAAFQKAAAVFDLAKIQIAAALKATYDKDERLRLLAMQEIENDNGEAALAYIKQLDLLTKEQQTNALAGIKTISETELNYINQLLLDELQRIKTTKMSESEAAEARQAAYAKYNAAIAQSGGLAAANFYSEKTQMESLQIARLASLDTVAAAQATMDLLNYTTQKTIIERIAAAQKIADDAKYKALQDYLALLATPINPPVLVPPSGPKGPKFGIGGQPIYPEGGGFADYMGTATTSSSGGSVDNSVTIVVEGSVLDGDDFSEIINRTMLNNIRRGFSQSVAGALP
jgi:hypothetical protein